jgi:hypothetical protein
MKYPLLLLALAATILSGCNTPSYQAAMTPSAAPVSLMEDVSPPPAVTSLFPSDQAVLSDEAVAKILSSKLELPEKVKVALMKFPDDGWGSREYGRFYWRDEQYLKLQQSQIDTLSEALMTSGQASDVTPLPTLMTPKQLTLPTLREAALRMQSDLLLVYRINSDTYTEYRTFAKDQVKAYSTCEIVLLDIRTGLVPFTRVISREQLEQKQSADLDLSETMRRAEEKSAVSSLNAAVGDLVNFLKNAPKRVP